MTRTPDAAASSAADFVSPSTACLFATSHVGGTKMDHIFCRARVFHEKDLSWVALRLQHHVVELVHECRFVRPALSRRGMACSTRTSFASVSRALIVSAMNALSGIALGSLLLFRRSVCTQGGAIS